MPASQGTPTIFDKIRVGLDTLTGKNPAPGSPDAMTLAGLQADVHKDITVVETLFGPTIASIETAALGDVTTLLTGIAKAVPVGGFTSFAQAASGILGAAKVLSPAVASQFGSIQSTALQTLIGAALTAAGHVNLPAA